MISDLQLSFSVYLNDLVVTFLNWNITTTLVKKYLLLKGNNTNWQNGFVLSFDLDTDLLKQHYSIHYSGAYRLIKNFLLKNGFEHNQDSDYINPNITRSDVVNVLVDLSYKYSCFPLSAKKLI